MAHSQQSSVYTPVRPTSHHPSHSPSASHSRLSASRDPTPSGHPRSGPKPSKTHAFGGDSDDEHSDSDDDGLGFQVYKDKPANARYTNLSTAPTLRDQTPVSAHSHSSQSRLNPSATASTYLSPPPGPPATKATGGYQPARSDMVHMPALGSDWERNEGKRDKDWEGKEATIDRRKWMSRKQELDKRRSAAGQALHEWLAGERKLFGWFSRIVALIFACFVLLAIFLLVFFLVPRTPSIAYNNQTFLTSDSVGASFRRANPVDFSFNAKMNLAFEAKNSYVKPKATNIVAIVKDLSSSGSAVEVGRGSVTGGVFVSTKDYTPFVVDMKFSYSASSIKDPVWASWYAACGHKWPGNDTRPTIQLGVIVNWNVQGAIGSHSERTVLNNVTCPVELPANAA